MLDIIDWEKAWSDARSVSPLKAYDSTSDWNVYWDYIASNQKHVPMIGELLDNDIIDHILRENILRHGDLVLDIGCGGGTYAIPFASVASSVTGLDLSEPMLLKMQEVAIANRVFNVRSVRSRWESYDESIKYDLVFSAFCHGIRDTSTLLKMERYSRRSCCYVAGSADQFRLLSEVWKAVFNKDYSSDAFNIIYPLNFLCHSGRNPSIRAFTYESEYTIGPEALVEEFVKYFGSFMKTGSGVESRIRDCIMQLSEGGDYRVSGKRTVYALNWNVPGCFMTK